MDKKIKGLDELRNGDTVVMHGLVEYDRFDHESVLRPDSIATVKKIPRRDLAEEKRVELHMHSNMYRDGRDDSGCETGSEGL